MNIRISAVPWFGLAALTGVAAAQPPALTYDSAYADYRAYGEVSPAAWREVNDEVASIGGHAGIFRAPGHREDTAKPPVHGADQAKPATPPAAMPRHGGGHH